MSPKSRLSVTMPKKMVAFTLLVVSLVSSLLLQSSLTLAEDSVAKQPAPPANNKTIDSAAQQVQAGDIDRVNLVKFEPRIVDEAKRVLKDRMSYNDNRIIMNRPTPQPQQVVDFAPGSPEAEVSEATANFGLEFLKNMPSELKGNVVISPISLQNLLNIILLGSTDSSATQQELSKTLGYEGTKLMGANFTESRLKPHEAMRSVLQNIVAATHLSVNEGDSLLNIDQAAVNATATTTEAPSKDGQVVAHLQTANKQNGVPLSGQVNFTLANLLLIDEGKMTLEKDYESNLKSYYNVNIEKFQKAGAKISGDQVVVSNATAATSSPVPAIQQLPLYERINNWVKNMTQNQIDKLAKEEDLSGEDLVMVLLNAAHFKGRWLRTFNTKATQDMTFFNHGKEQDATKVKFMRQKAEFGYAEFGPNALGSDLATKVNFSVLMLPFSLNDGQELSMTLILPSKRDGLDELQAYLNASLLNEISKSLSEQQVQVEIPKFAFESSHDVRDTLLRMGLKSIFTNGAQLARMSAQRDVKVDKIIHKAKIMVDESGAEAAAASIATVMLRTHVIRPPTPTFLADHPFLFLIREDRSNMPLFMGRVTSFEPSK